MTQEIDTTITKEIAQLADKVYQAAAELNGLIVLARDAGLKVRLFSDGLVNPFVEVVIDTQLKYK